MKSWGPWPCFPTQILGQPAYANSQYMLQAIPVMSSEYMV